MNAKQLTNLLESIERNLTEWIPMGVKELEIKSPAYCLFLWYMDFEGEFTPQFGIATQELLDVVAKSKFEDPVDKYDILWRPPQCADLSVPGCLVVDECDIVESDVEMCYELLASNLGLLDDDSDDDDEFDDEQEEIAADASDQSLLEDDLSDEEFDEEIEKEFEALEPFREMMHRVGKSLSEVDWKRIMPVTENFVVLVCDYVGYWLSEDFEQCVSSEKIDALIQKGLLMNPGNEEPKQ